MTKLLIVMSLSIFNNVYADTSFNVKATGSTCDGNYYQGVDDAFSIGCLQNAWRHNETKCQVWTQSISNGTKENIQNGNTTCEPEIVTIYRCNEGYHFNNTTETCDVNESITCQAGEYYSVDTSECLTLTVGDVDVSGVETLITSTNELLLEFFSSVTGGLIAICLILGIAYFRRTL